MRVSQRLDYTLRMLIALARVPAGTNAAAGELAESIGLPRRFGEQQMTGLAKTGLVDSRRGTGGGVSLTRHPSEITLLDIVRSAQGDALDVPKDRASAAAEFWAQTAVTLEEWLASTTLQDLADRQAELDASKEMMYFI